MRRRTAALSSWCGSSSRREPTARNRASPDRALAEGGGPAGTTALFRLHRADLAQPLDLVLVARPSIAGKPFQAVEKDFLTTLRRAGLVKVPEPKVAGLRR